MIDPFQCAAREEKKGERGSRCSRQKQSCRTFRGLPEFLGAKSQVSKSASKNSEKPRERIKEQTLPGPSIVSRYFRSEEFGVAERYARSPADGDAERALAPASLPSLPFFPRSFSSSPPPFSLLASARLLFIHRLSLPRRPLSFSVSRSLSLSFTSCARGRSREKRTTARCSGRADSNCVISGGRCAH